MTKAVIFFILSVVSVVLADEVIYRTFLGSIPVGEVKISVKEESVTAEGSTYPYISWLYSYNFKFVMDKDNFYLYEKENEKEKIFDKEKIYEKKPWLPLVVEYIMFGKNTSSDLYPIKIEKKDNIYVIYPLKSKRVKKIVMHIDESRFPLKIDIDGKYHIVLERHSINQSP
ncbi:hypothetical protein [Persephonella sp.]